MSAFGRTHPCVAINGCRAIQRFDSANSALELQRVFLQSPVTHFHVAKLPLDHAKRVLNLGADACLELFDLLNERIDRVARLVQLISLARTHGDVPAHTGVGVGTPVGALVPRIGKHDGLLAMQQAAAFGDIGHMTGRAAHRMH